LCPMRNRMHCLRPPRWQHHNHRSCLVHNSNSWILCQHQLQWNGDCMHNWSSYMHLQCWCSYCPYLLSGLLPESCRTMRVLLLQDLQLSYLLRSRTSPHSLDLRLRIHDVRKHLLSRCCLHVLHDVLLHGDGCPPRCLLPHLKRLTERQSIVYVKDTHTQKNLYQAST